MMSVRCLKLVQDFLIALISLGRTHALVLMDSAVLVHLEIALVGFSICGIVCIHLRKVLLLIGIQPEVKILSENVLLENGMMFRIEPYRPLNLFTQSQVKEKG